VSSSGSYSNSNSGVSATAGGDRTVDRTTSVNSGCGSSNSGSGGNNGNSGGSGFDGWESRQQSQRERSNSSRVDYRAERTANSDVLRGIGNTYSDIVAATVATAPSDSNRSSFLTPLSPSDSDRGNHHRHGHDGDVVIIPTGTPRGSLIDHTDRRDRSDRSRGAREERTRERESRNRDSTASDAAIYGETSNRAPTYANNANGTATIPLPTDGFERLGSSGQHLDYRT